MKENKIRVDMIKFFLSKGDLPQAINHLEEFLSMVDREDFIKFGLLLAECYYLSGEYTSVRDIFKKLVAKAVSRQELDLLAMKSIEYRLDAGLVCDKYEKYVRKNTADKNAVFNLAYYFSKGYEYRKSNYLYEKLLNSAFEGGYEAFLNLANNYNEYFQDNRKAVELIESCLKISPGDKRALLNLVNIHEQEGNFKEALKVLLEYIEHNSGDPYGWARYLDICDVSEKIHVPLEKLEKLAYSTKDIDLCYSLGRYFERNQDYEKSWSYYSAANEILRAKQRRFNVSIFNKEVDRHVKNSNLESIPDVDVGSVIPVFIVGAFRSGTTLLEQIISQNSLFLATGERYFIPMIKRSLEFSGLNICDLSRKKLEHIGGRYLKESFDIYGGSTFIVDKMPDNIFNVDLILRLFPNCKVIYLSRDWKDIAISIYSHRFGEAQNYSTSVEDIRKYCDGVARIADFYLKETPERFIQVRYEDVVNNSMLTINNLFEFLGVTHHEEWQEFYNTKSAIRTPSSWQVRKPINSSSVGRWENFRDFCPSFD